MRVLDRGMAVRHIPVAFERYCCADVALVKRLTCTAQLPSEASTVSTLCWGEQPDLLVSGGEDCRLTLWSTERRRATLTLEVVRIALPRL